MNIPKYSKLLYKLSEKRLSGKVIVQETSVASDVDWEAYSNRFKNETWYWQPLQQEACDCCGHTTFTHSKDKEKRPQIYK